MKKHRYASCKNSIGFFKLAVICSMPTIVMIIVVRAIVLGV